MNGRRVHKITLDGVKEEITIRECKVWITVGENNGTKESFCGIGGMMDSHENGTWLARDGKTIHCSIEEFGQDWHVRAGKDKPSPYPKVCHHPPKTAENMRMRRLEESIPCDVALEACKDKMRIDDCVMDVQASGDCLGSMH